MNIAHTFGYKRYKLRKKRWQNNTKNDANDDPTQKTIGGVSKLLSQKLFDRWLTLERQEHENVKKNTANKDKNHPVIVLHQSYQFDFFCKNTHIERTFWRNDCRQHLVCIFKTSKQEQIGSE